MGYEYRRESNRAPRSVVSSAKIRRGRFSINDRIISSLIRDFSVDRVPPSPFRRFRTASQYGFDSSFIFIFIFYFLFFTGSSSTCVPNSSAKRSQPVYVPRCFEVRERTRLFRQLGILFSLTRSLMHSFFFLRAFYIRHYIVQM